MTIQHAFVDLLAFNAFSKAQDSGCASIRCKGSDYSSLMIGASLRCLSWSFPRVSVDSGDSLASQEMLRSQAVLTKD